MKTKKDTQKNSKQKAWQKKYPKGKASLSWSISDYMTWQVEPPECMICNPALTEGEQLSNNDLENWFVDSIKTLKIFKETDPITFEKLYKEIILDIEYLISIDRLEENYLDFVQDKNNFKF